MLAGIPLIFPGSLAALITGGLIGGTAVAFIAGGATLGIGITSTVIGSKRGAWTCDKTADYADELDVSEHLGQTKWEYREGVAELQALVDKFNEKHGGSRLRAGPLRRGPRPR